MRILLVDDESHVLAALVRLLRHALPKTTQVESHTSPLTALARATEVPFDAVLCDYRMPEMDGVAFLKAFRDIQPQVPRLILSGVTDFDVLMNAVNEVGLYRYLIKPWDDDEIIAAVRDSAMMHMREEEAHRLADERRAELGHMSPEELEKHRLEAEEPGITQVRWGPDGAIHLDED
jgi:two-component system, probable response regulator PhcQ